jgi:hypothetical protein
MVRCFFRERESGMAGGEISGGPGAPHHCMARPALARATRWCGGMVGPTGLFRMPLCPILDVKN